MDSYSPSSPVYRPGAESDWEEDTGTPVYRSPTPPAARPRFDVRADWIRNTGTRLRRPGSPPHRNQYQTPHLHTQLPPPLRDPYLVPDPYHPNPWVRHTTATTSVMGFPTNDIHQYVRTSEFERQRMEQGIDYPNDHSNARLGDYLSSSGKLPETLAEISIYYL
ncbi:hypothetical protein L1987_76193 [Smallanthus sonchifolius]|uniref:Uncharacterized protein n=1 Tax=Smallanthus sonchifolius TaxID=185202 RepID=A0ACB9A6V1_9ASTR|nr:hypothetical protein L1987_76193 [Smallanthus sonchifolius]